MPRSRDHGHEPLERAQLAAVPLPEIDGPQRAGLDEDREVAHHERRTERAGYLREQAILVRADGIAKDHAASVRRAAPDVDQDPIHRGCPREEERHALLDGAAHADGTDRTDGERELVLILREHGETRTGRVPLRVDR